MTAADQETSSACDWRGCNKPVLVGSHCDVDGYCMDHCCFICLPLDGWCDACPADVGHGKESIP